MTSQKDPINRRKKHIDESIRDAPSSSKGQIEADTKASFDELSPPSKKEKFDCSIGRGRGRKNDLSVKCIICNQPFKEPYSTTCGHTFCHNCIIQQASINGRCPSCETIIDAKKPDIFPNFAIANFVQRFDRGNDLSSQSTGRASVNNSDEIVKAVLQTSDLDLNELNKIAAAVDQRRNYLEQTNEQLYSLLYLEFLDKLIESREIASQQIEDELKRLRHDKQRILASFSMKHKTLTTSPSNNSGTDATLICSTSSVDLPNSKPIDDPVYALPSLQKKYFPFAEPLMKYRFRLYRHLKCLEQFYFPIEKAKIKSERQTIKQNTATQVPICSFSESSSVETLAEEVKGKRFDSILRAMCRWNDAKRLAVLNYNPGSLAPIVAIVSAIEFDKDDEFFAIAGVTKWIKLYNFDSVIKAASYRRSRGLNGEADVYPPLHQFQCGNKISSLSFNPYSKSLLASSDYDGIVQLWDTDSARTTRIYREHEKRCWSVHFNQIDPHMFASGSDDTRVKLWSVRDPYSIATIEAKVNVCSVCFSPTRINQLVIGSSDHNAHLYDVRFLSRTVKIFRGHQKAVSYVKFITPNEVITASTDSTLRIWDACTGKCTQTFQGHQNEKNFVGLATSFDGENIICGSENNRLYIYHREISAPLMAYDFTSASCVPTTFDELSHEPNEGPNFTTLIPSSSNVNGEFENSTSNFNSTDAATNNTARIAGTTDSDCHQTSHLHDYFVSSLCWKKDSNVIIGANSKGLCNILKLE